MFACKQGEGDVCQVTLDCQDGLECNAGTQRCQKPGGATPTTDAAVPVVDAAPVVDAMPPVVDAMPPVVDAAPPVVDAMLPM